MNRTHNLTLQTATAIGGLAELQRRADRSEQRSPIARTALAELSTALEELQVANEQLQIQFDELRTLRRSAEDAQRTVDEFAGAVPIASVWTDGAGVILSGNDAASQLLNVGKYHLVGKSLMLFIVDRGPLFAAQRALGQANQLGAVDLEVTVRPRERRPRKMTLAGRRLQDDQRCLWFFYRLEPATVDEATTVIAGA